jgi:NADPH:quinone reductase-like Zn-dependent oxidoreductase
MGAAFQALVLCSGIKGGDDVLIHAGASGVGIAAIQLSRAYGANTVTATASTKEKLDSLLAMPNGATHVANYKTQDFSAEVKKTTQGKGVDVIIDFVGQSHWNKNIDSLALDGRMTILALLSGSQVASTNIAPILFKRLRIQGSTLRSQTIEYQETLIQRFKAEVIEKITGCGGQSPIKTYIHKVYPWTEIQEAHREMTADKNSGKIIVEVV